MAKMSEKELEKRFKTIRHFIGTVVHHAACNSREGKRCDCYAKRRERAAKALDELKEVLVQRVG